MKKRFTCGLLALVMVLCLIPTAVLPVHAASDLSSSEEVIEFIKEVEGFSATAFWDVNQWSIGYGTNGQKGQTITEKQADKALRAHLADIDDAINTFSDKYDLDLDQSEHDALASFSFNVGTGWMKTSGRFRDGLINGASENEFLYYISLWANINSVPDRSLIGRRLCEANMFFNGDYDTDYPYDYSFVIYDANGGKAGSGGEDKMQGYLVSRGASIMVADPTKSGTRFIGWFTERKGGEEVTYLDESTAEKTLYAHYEDDSSEELGDVIATGKVSCKNYVNVRSGAGTNYTMVGQAPNGTKLEIYEMKTVGGVKWCKVHNGWICMDYVKLDEELPDNDEDDEEEIEESDDYEDGVPGVVVNAAVVNVRKAAGTSNPVVATLKLGTKVTVYQQVKKDNAPWGRIDEGWICLNYVRVSDEEETEEEETSDEILATGKVSSKTNLNVRSGPGTDYSRVNFLAPGTRVTVYETKTTQGQRWGRIGEKRWVCLTYVTMDDDEEQDDQDDYDDRYDDDDDRYEEDAYTGRVSSKTSLNVRSGPGTNYKRVDMLKPGTKVTVYEEEKVNGVAWGRIDDDCWVCLDYITADRSNSDDEDDDDGDSLGTGRVSCLTVLNVRGGAGTGYSIVDRLIPGTKVEILEKKSSGGLTWGRIEDGWVCMTYIRMD